MATKKVHPGFGAVQKKIMMKEGMSKESAGAVLAAAARKASPVAVKANPKLAKISGVAKPKGKKK
jgi:hypothetical protein